MAVMDKVIQIDCIFQKKVREWESGCPPYVLFVLVAKLVNRRGVIVTPLCVILFACWNTPLLLL